LAPQPSWKGSIQKSGNKIRITAQLIDTKDETHIWSERYDSEEKDIFSIQDDIVSRIVQKLRGSLALNEAKTKIPTTNLQAYELFLRGRHFRSKSFGGQQQALKYYQQAIDLEPTFAQAYAEMALTYWYMGVFGLMTQKESLIKAKEIVLKAISLDDTSCDAYNILGYISLIGDSDTQAYQENYEKAVSLGLPLPDPWHGYYEQWFLGITDKAVKDARFLVEKDPLSVDALVHLSRISLGARQYEEVIQAGIRALELSPDHSSIFRHTSEAYLFTNRPQMALPYVEKLMSKNPYYAPQDFVAVQVKLGNRELAVKKFNEVKDSIALGKKAICYIHLGKIDSALLTLEEGVRQKDIHLVGMNLEEHFDALKGHARYLEILKKLNARE
jgi:adenylate cyclase